MLHVSLVKSLSVLIVFFCVNACIEDMATFTILVELNFMFMQYHKVDGLGEISSISSKNL